MCGRVGGDRRKSAAARINKGEPSRQCVFNEKINSELSLPAATGRDCCSELSKQEHQEEPLQPPVCCTTAATLVFIVVRELLHCESGNRNQSNGDAWIMNGSLSSFLQFTEDNENDGSSSEMRAPRTAKCQKQTTDDLFLATTPTTTLYPYCTVLAPHLVFNIIQPVVTVTASQNISFNTCNLSLYTTQSLFARFYSLSIYRCRKPIIKAIWSVVQQRVPLLASELDRK